MKRLSIAVFYDEKGFVDDYTIFFLKELRKVSEIITICNGTITNAGRQKLSDFGQVLARPNEGFDVEAWKEVMIDIGWDHLASYDSLILCNFTCFGPFRPFAEIFDEMDQRGLDFWGLTPHFALDHDSMGCGVYDHIHKHIQANFMVFNKSLLAAPEFRKHWMQLPPIKEYNHAVGYHESVFTKKFADMGFRWGTYTHCDDLESYCAYPLLDMPLEMVANKNCPVIKRRSFFGDYANILSRTTGNAASDVFEYIEKHVPYYDVSLIYQNILRTLPQADIKNFLHQTYILPTGVNLGELACKEKIALIMHIYYLEMVDTCLKYASSMPETADIFVTVSKEDVRAEAENKFSQLKCNHFEVRLVKNHGRDVGAFLVGCKDIVMNYDFVCFSHDKKTADTKPGSIGRSFFYRCMENILCNKIYVDNVIDIMRKHNRIGLLSPPPPNHGGYYFTTSMEWGTDFEETTHLLEDFDITVPFSKDKEPVCPMGTNFWFRPAALKQLFDRNWEYDDLPPEPIGSDGTFLHAIERAYPFFVQEAGYISAWVMSDTYARIELTNLNYMLREINLLLNPIFRFNTFQDTRSYLKNMVHEYELAHGISPQSEDIPSTVVHQPFIRRLGRKLLPRRLRDWIRKLVM